MSILVLPNPLKKSQSLPSDLYSIKVTPNIPDAGTVQGGGMASKGSLMALKSTYNSGYAFEGWKENGNILSRDPSYIFPVERDQDIEASFLESPVLQLGVSWKGGEFTSTVIGTSGKTATKRAAYGNGWFVVIPTNTQSANAGVMRSNDCLTWTRVDTTSSSRIAYPMDITYGNGMFVILTSSGKIWYSENDGLNWYSVSLPNTTASWAYLKYANGMFVALVSNGVQAAYSSDGKSWSSITMPVSGTWSGLGYYLGCFIAHNRTNGKFYYSETGESWNVSSKASMNDTTIKRDFIVLDDILYLIPEKDVVSGIRYFYRTRTKVSPSNANFEVTRTILNDTGFGYETQTMTTGCNDDEGRIGIMLMNNSPTYYTLDGNNTSWKVGSMPYNVGWSHITYGNGMFLAVSDTEHYAISYTGNE